MREESKLWLEAAKILAVNVDALVQCPVCGKGLLEVIDVENKMDDKVFERHLICSSCGANNSMRMRRE
jgi:transcription elongation factor Elf1